MSKNISPLTIKSLEFVPQSGHQKAKNDELNKIKWFLLNCAKKHKKGI